MYTAIIHIQSRNNVNHLKEVSQTTNSLNTQLRCDELEKKLNNMIKACVPLCKQSIIESCCNFVSEMQNSISKNLVCDSFDMFQNLKCILPNYIASIQKSMEYISASFLQYKRLYDKNLFLEIADEIGFPIYLEVDSELQDRLIYSYRQNGNQCNKKEMCGIILDYYDDECIDYILNGIKNVQVFNSERVKLIEEGIEAYQLGLYAPSASLFTDQLSGMIRDVYDELIRFHRISYKEKKELIISFNQNCKPDSEKGMLLQIVDSQSTRFIVWHKVLWHFLDIVYSPKGRDMATQPQRHMICHGKQTNYNTKEMNLKLILCMDIITELAWGIRKMREECSEVVIDV